MKITKRQLRRIIREGLFGDRTSKQRSPKQEYQGKTKFKVEVDSLYKMVVINTIRDGQAMIYAEDINSLIEALQTIKIEADQL
jgi:hypothetical protein